MIDAIGTQSRDLMNSSISRWWLKVKMDAFLYRGKREEGKEPMSKHQVQSGCGEEADWCGTGRPSPSRETKLSGANGDSDYSISFSLFS